MDDWTKLLPVSVAYSWDNGNTWYCTNCQEKLEPSVEHSCEPRPEGVWR